MIIRTGNCAEAHTVFDRCLQVSREVKAPYWSAQALAMLGLVAHRQGSHEEGQRFYEASLNLFESVGDQWGVAYTLSVRANYAFLAGQVTELDQKAYQKSLALFRAAGDTAYEANVLRYLGIESYYQGRYSSARALLQDSLELSRRVDYVSHTASTLAFLGMVAVAQGDTAAASKHLHESIMILATAGHRYTIAEAFDACSVLAFARQEPAQALRFGGAAAAVRAAIGVRLFPIAQSHLDVIYQKARQRLNTEEADAAWAAGAAMTLEGALAYALAV
jgi:tetratricopeptide (TPR) repeat protein